MRVPTRSAGTRSGVNCRRLNEPPSTSATVLTVSVLARPGTPSSRTWPPARSATSTRSSIASWPTITRLISKSADSSASWAARSGRGSCSPSSAWRRRSSGVTGLLVPLGLVRGRLARLRSQRHREGTPFAAALHHNLDLLTGLAVVDRGGEVVGVAHGLAADLHDAVALPDARLLGGTARVDLPDHGAALRRLARAHAEVGVRDGLAVLQERQDALDLVDRDGEADAGVRAALTRDLGVDADDAALRVQQRAAGVAGVDRGVGLDRTGDREPVRRLDRAVER